LSPFTLYTPISTASEANMSNYELPHLENLK
jgi:hypothetical protein